MEAIQRHLFCKKRMFSVRPPTKFFLENKNVVLWINKSRNLGTWCLLFLERFPFHSFYSLSLSLFLSHRSFHSSEEKKKRRITQCFNQSKSKKKKMLRRLLCETWNWSESNAFFLFLFHWTFLLFFGLRHYETACSIPKYSTTMGVIYTYFFEISTMNRFCRWEYIWRTNIWKKKKLKFSQLKHESYSAMRFHIVLKWFPHRLESNHYMLIACAQ